MTTAQTSYRLKTLLCGLLISTCALSNMQRLDCSNYDFITYWPTVFEGYLAETLSEHNAPPQIIQGSQPSIYWNQAVRKSTGAFLEFAELLKEYPAFCRLKLLPMNHQTSIMFSTLVHEREALSRALDAGQLSASWLTTTAFNQPHFVANLLGHMSVLGELTHTLFVNSTQLTYFQRLANTLVKDQSARPEAKRVYSKAFCYLMLMLNEGRNEADLEKFVHVISTLPEAGFSDFLLLDLLSTASVDTDVEQ